jgi:hypothetical protein
MSYDDDAEDWLSRELRTTNRADAKAALDDPTVKRRGRPRLPRQTSPRPAQEPREAFPRGRSRSRTFRALARAYGRAAATGPEADLERVFRLVAEAVRRDKTLNVPGFGSFFERNGRLGFRPEKRRTS